MKVGINGMGRLGQTVLRAAMGAVQRAADDPRRDNRLDIVHLNDFRGNTATLAQRLKSDSIHGAWSADVEAIDNSQLRIGDRLLRFTSNAAPADIPWHELGVELVIECSGKFLAAGAVQGHLYRGVKRVIVAAGIDACGVVNLMMGINEQCYDPARHAVVAAGCSVTNCLAPIIKVVHEAIGIRHGQIITIHDPTHASLGMATQDGEHAPARSVLSSLRGATNDSGAGHLAASGNTVAVPDADLRLSPAAARGQAQVANDNETSIALVYPELRGKISGRAVQVPVLHAALTDCTFELRRVSSAEEVNVLFAQAARSALPGILDYQPGSRPGGEYARDTRSCIIDGPATLVTDGTLLKVFAWHGNEMGYACRLVDLATHMRGVGI
ncbi:glyceraldehyde 3-phosphate dehydrogenase NAD-binding domain-containing protein [Lacisediminimonas sp.]|uniref:glyceraldehyde 3-phosphate dehydrogenase NAD-binding domain-containing protein n=1 Tax=Lacisediminimonas sp. TaxID=3060582 RepID=UPI00271ED218|nr:glyceraldehyde 3-phosphate dehydrogenase NAD-binding domain-containing protein [Lacisediminimonas sp.]MDO8298730.1 glyceraldehyde 3-phosphate dehydrogenase NAD-binding domain-containing protein [Lacisediminimonas sp.]